MWSDKESSLDYLNFSEVSQLAVDILRNEQMLPVSIGIFGNWGAGKSSLLKLIENDLKNGKHQDNTRDFIIVNFDAWLYQGYDDARAALLETIAATLKEAAKNNKSLSSKIKNFCKRINALRLIGLCAEGTALLSGIPTGGVLHQAINAYEHISDGIQTQEEYEETSNLAKKVKDTHENLINNKIIETPPQQITAIRNEYRAILKKLDKPLIVIIDNLDRCLPTNAIQTLEAIRLFLFMENTAFVIAADEDMIRASVAEYFKGLSPRHQIDYLDKLIQIPIRVPKSGVREILSYLFMLYAVSHKLNDEKLHQLRETLENSLQQSWNSVPMSKQDALKLINEENNQTLAADFDLAERIAPILASSSIIQGNPRVVKRLLNVVKMRTQIATRRKMPLDESIITKFVIFERCASATATADFYRLIDAEKGFPKLIKEMEQSHGELPQDAPKSWTENSTTKDFISQWSNLEPPLANVDLRAAVYLSRETIPMGFNNTGLSEKGTETLNILLNLANASSPAAHDAIYSLPPKEYIPIMENMLTHLRRVQDWNKRPIGFAGACLLADKSPESAQILNRFLDELSQRIDKQPPWLKQSLKNKSWSHT